MPTQITQTILDGRTHLKVEGEMLLEDALLLEKIIGSSANQDATVIVDLADLYFFDSESAQVLRRLQSTLHVEIIGIEIFLQSAVNAAERETYS